MAVQPSDDPFRWLNLLESEFDKALVVLDIYFQRVNPGNRAIESSDLNDYRDKLSTVSSAFAQLSQKAQTIFETNARQAAQIIALKDELEVAISQRSAAESELQSYLLQLHLSQMQLQKRLGKNVNVENIQETLNREVERHKRHMSKQYRVQSALQILRNENEDLKKYIASIQNELYGTRLAAKYLEKELAGRIQQNQLLCRKLGKNEHDPLWDTLESEIRMQRHKTVIRACRGRLSVSEVYAIKSTQGVGCCRQVTLIRSPNEGLGISVTGGMDYGVPIVISDIHPTQLAARSGGLFVGDTILAVNGISLVNQRHNDAVKTLAAQQGKVILDVMLLPAENDDSDDEDRIYTDETGYKFRLYDETKTIPSHFTFQIDHPNNITTEEATTSTNACQSVDSEADNSPEMSVESIEQRIRSDLSPVEGRPCHPERPPCRNNINNRPRTPKATNCVMERPVSTAAKQTTPLPAHDIVTGKSSIDMQAHSLDCQTDRMTRINAALQNFCEITDINERKFSESPLAFTRSTRAPIGLGLAKPVSCGPIEYPVNNEINEIQVLARTNPT